MEQPARPPSRVAGLRGAAQVLQAAGLRGATSAAIRLPRLACGPPPALRARQWQRVPSLLRAEPEQRSRLEQQDLELRPEPQPQVQPLQPSQPQQQPVGRLAPSSHRQQEAVRQPTPSSLGSKLPLGLAALAGVTLVVAVLRVLRRHNDPRHKQQVLGRKNKLVVESLSEYLPERRQELSSNQARRLSLKTGFKPEEIFRKYLWYLLKERSFDQAALDDLVHLKQVLRLSDMQVAGAVHARAERIQKRYGTVMLNTAGMTTAGVERKATTRALFSKLLYLSEYEPLCAAAGATEQTSIKKLFGVSNEDAEQFRLDGLG